MGCEFKTQDVSESVSRSLFPSVSLGPINIDKAKSSLHFKPTPLVSIRFLN